MKLNRLVSSVLAGLGAVLIFGTAWGQSSGTVGDAFAVARQTVAPSVQTQVVSCYGVGTPATILKWYIIFYDPSVPTHGRVVLVDNGRVARTYPANGGRIYSETLSFDPSRLTSEAGALNAAQGYAARHKIAYDSVTALLSQTALNKPFRWKIGLRTIGESRGFVYVNALDDTVAAYSSPPTTGSGATTESTSKTAAGLGNQVKTTFLGIGGDLEEFFTGERTVDK